MNRKQINIPICLAGFSLILSISSTNAQTIVKPGEISGIWNKKSSPYMIRGDLNIPSGKTLIIQPGVIVRFTGPYLINVQGNLIAEGTNNDSIVFTVSDTTGIIGKNNNGWNGIRFDRRPVKWDTTLFKMPKKEEFVAIVNERIKNGSLDTTTKIRLFLKIPDVINDTVLKDSLFLVSKGSKLAYCRFEFATSVGRKQPYVFGGAIYVYRYSNLVISNCVFENNFAYAGGAIFCVEAAPVIKGNRFAKCSAQSSGGAMAFMHSGPIVLNNSINYNFSGHNGGAMFFYESSAYVLNNTVLRNRAENSGGAVFCEQEYDSLLWSGIYSPAERVKFARDIAFEKANLNTLYLKGSSSFYGRFINNIICDNKAMTGGGISLHGTAPEFTNITLSNNLADTAGGGIYSILSASQITNSIIYGNSNDQIFLIGENHPVFSYCDIESGIEGIKKDTTCRSVFEYTGISTFPPKFKSPAGDDYSLDKESGCIDAGMPDTLSLHLSALDLAGKTRIVNGIIDLGALEYTGSKTTLKSTEEKIEVAEELENNTDELFTSIFPNPSEGAFFIVIHNNTYESIAIKIFSQTGQNVYSDEFNAGSCFEKQIELTGYLQGIYIVMIYSDDVLLYNGEIIIE